jgi:hypothetical protein
VRGGWLVTFKQHDSGEEVLRVYVSDRAIDDGAPEKAVTEARRLAAGSLSGARSVSFEAVRVHGEVTR